MKKFTPYPKIGQFRQIVRHISDKTRYAGQDINDEPIFNHNLPLPKIKFKGTVKIHGTNAGVVYNHIDGYWAQSRSRIITVDNDNAGFAFFAESVKGDMISEINMIAMDYNIDLNENSIAIFGEWAGKGIQRGVAISEVERNFYVFGAKVIPFGEELSSYYLENFYVSHAFKKILPIDLFKNFLMEIDFNNPGDAINDLVKITEEVEKQCPVGIAMGKDGIGEGVVWKAFVDGEQIMFKVKGEKHQSSKVKKLASVDPDKIENVKKFVEYAVTDSRFSQALENVFGISGAPDIKKLGDLIKWTMSDILKEELDVMVKSNLVPKDIGGKVANEVKQRFFKLV